MAKYRCYDGKIVSVQFDLKCRNGKMKDGNKRRFRNLLKALCLLIEADERGVEHGGD